MNTSDSQTNLEKSAESIKNALIAKGKTLSNNNSQALKGMVEDNAFTAVQDLVSSTVRDDGDINYGIFMDADLLAWVHATPENPEGTVTPGQELTDEVSEWAASLENQDFKTVPKEDGNDIYEFASPVIVDDEILGVIRYGISTKSMRESLSKAEAASKLSLQKTLGILLAAVIGALVVGVLSTRNVAHRITTPLKSLQSSAGTIASGNYDDAVTVSTNDEIGVLADNFEQMRSTIKKKMADLAKLNSSGEILASLTDQAKALEVVLHTMHEQIGVSHGSVYLMNDDNEMEVKAFFPPKKIAQDSKPKKFAAGEGILGRAAKEKEVIFIPNTKEEQSFEHNEHDQARALLCVPLMDKDIVIGVMNLSGSIDEVRFEESDNEFVSSIARLLVITIKNIRMREVIEEQNRTLEQKVEARTAELAEKTNDISSMLMNMHQGLFTIMEGGIIHHEYAVYLEKIFETQHIASRNFMDLLFTDTDIGSNGQDQVKTAIEALIGSDEMMYDFNSHLLITEVSKTMEDGRVKILDFDWDPIILDGDIDKIMVTVRDVTELKALQKEAEAQKRDLEIIGQILAVGQEKMAEFLSSGFNFINECRDLITNTAEKDLDVIATLFRNMHTIKGNARTYNFAYITNSVHEVETTYDELRKQEDKEWQQEQLLEELLTAEKDIEYYRDVAREKLGYDESGGGSVLDSEQVKNILEKIKALDTQALDAPVKEVVDKTYQLFISGDAKPIGNVIDGVIQSVDSLAKELEKTPPKVNISDAGLLIKKDFYNMMNNIFMHVFRNAMDHGIESNNERKEKGKPEQGSIFLETELNSSMATFKIYDDGRGLAISKLFSKAVNDGLYEEGNKPADLEIANLIFASGFSTAEEVTEVSGRGVGMDAVRQFLIEEGGNIEVCLEDDKEGSDFRAFSTKISLPDKFYLLSN
ncbi:GAF domain-containing protein [Pleionea sp. CnH1-48]|uniref:GAF domain-containing protein n=1 Tax=Pleionea sp. CnH1-48 TaxID=2954494 RepID=UPI00209769E2|nr:GAF domain-containing protein [Pleionea sp. CnH1-48]MCO7223731.1 GAF domain-containing protein [Pleionea sp. CnH1-48]